MAQRTKTEKRLLKATSIESHEQESIQLITSPKIFTNLFQLFQRYLKDQNNSQSSREFLAQMAFAFRQEAYKRFGHDSAETFALAKLLRQVGDGPASAKGRPDALTYLNKSDNPRTRLTADEMSAVEYIQKIWQAFGRFLFMGTRNLERAGTRSRVLSPMDVMTEDTWIHYKEIYCPWYEVAKKITVNRRQTGGPLSVASITFKIVVEDVYPDALDLGFAMTEGTALRAFKAGLRAYGEPESLRRWANRPVQPLGRPLAGKLEVPNGEGPKEEKTAA